MRPVATIMGVSFEEHLRSKPEVSILILASETYRDDYLHLLGYVMEAFRNEPVDEIMAGNRRTLDILHSVPNFDGTPINLPRRSVPGGEHVIASISRLQGRA